jgi:hypothetical protein
MESGGRAKRQRRQGIPLGEDDCGSRAQVGEGPQGRTALPDLSLSLSLSPLPSRGSAGHMGQLTKTTHTQRGSLPASLRVGWPRETTCRSRVAGHQDKEEEIMEAWSHRAGQGPLGDAERCLL